MKIYLSLNIFLGLPIGNPFASHCFQTFTTTSTKVSGEHTQCLHRNIAADGLLP